MVEKSSKSNENKCTHCAMRLVLIGKHAHSKGNIRHVRYSSKAIASLQLLIFYIKNRKNRKRSVFPLCDGFRLFLVLQNADG